MGTVSRDRIVLAVVAVGVVLLPSDTGHTQASTRPTIADTAACLERAERVTELVPVQRARLCVATPSPNAPVDCFIAATRTLLFTEAQGIELCRCSATLGPVACVRALRDSATLTEPEMLALCSPTITQSLRADCTPTP
jgi:hypothetical protein